TFMRNRPIVIVFAALLGFCGCKSSEVEIDQAAPKMHLEEVLYYSELFSHFADDVALVNQDEVIAAMRELRTCHDKMQGNLEPGNIEYLQSKIDSVYEKTREMFPVCTLQIADGRVTFAKKPQRLNLLRGIPSYVIVEIENKEAGSVEITAVFDGDPVGVRGKLAVPPGLTRAVLTKALADGPVKQTTLSILHNGEVSDFHIPARVSEPATLKGKLIDSDTGKVFPGRVYVKCSDGMYRHGKALADVKTLARRPILGYQMYVGYYKVPFFYSDGTFELDVPPGKTEITLERGFEHEIVSQTYELKSGETKEIAIASGRMMNMKELGWISGDTHVHWAENNWRENEDIELLALVQRAEDLRVANNLTLRQGGVNFLFTAPTQYPMGPVPGHSSGDYIIQMCEEYRNQTFYGHINLLNIKKLIEPISTGKLLGPNGTDYPVNYTAILEARRQGGIVIPAHGIPGECPADIALGLVDSLDQLNPDEYYRVLNSGFRLPLTNGSDHPARVAGCARAYVKVEGEFTYESWIDGIRAGRTFTTSGPLLFLDVNGSDIGSEVKLARGDMMNIKVRALSRRPIGRLQVISNDKMLVDVEVPELDREVELSVPAEESCWIVARCASNDLDIYNAIWGPDIAHTAATYVVVDGEPIFRPNAADVFAQQLRGHAENVAANAKFDNESQRQEAVDVMLRGAKVYEDLIALYQGTS
ncbi:CehA/McbA family metallohydrolase, partial [Candidatus Hydrogenedentota bacterium]